MSYTSFNTLRTQDEANVSILRSLRHIGFRKLEIPPDCERISDGPSLFHELAYCAAGQVSLQIRGDHGAFESFSAGKGDLIFIPAGTNFSIYSADGETAALILAIAREGVDVNALPLDHRGAEVLVVEKAVKTRLERAPDARNERIEQMVAVVDEDGHVVLFFDRRQSDVDEDDTIGGVFERSVLAREFGVRDEELPDLSLSFSETVVMRSNFSRNVPVPLVAP
ncbi:hypothetical protein JNB88_22735 [Rhizobium cauense]|uniref:hypothetical protein n=1 Tax=Rhizobium cauense TaxID=1166683 RepID=UPI001C6EBE81|nr:hypothetical protein [Rhizobium cauense]MBW9116457.1 hypothetical protein [Rhizobium cauense]